MSVRSSSSILLNPYDSGINNGGFRQSNYGSCLKVNGYIGVNNNSNNNQSMIGNSGICGGGGGGNVDDVRREVVKVDSRGSYHCNDGRVFLGRFSPQSVVSGYRGSYLNCSGIRNPGFGV